MKALLLGCAVAGAMLVAALFCQTTVAKGYFVTAALVLISLSFLGQICKR